MPRVLMPGSAPPPRRWRRSLRPLTLLPLTAALLLAGPAWAQTDLQRAQALVNAASEQFTQKNFEKALAALKEAEEIAAAAKDPSLASIRFNIARCYEELDRPRDALQAYERYNEVPDDPNRKQRAREAVAALKSKIYGVLSVSCQPTGALVAIEGLLATATPCPWTGQEVQPGKYTIKVSYAGFKTETQEVDVRAGQPTGATFRLKPIDDGPAVVVSAAPPPEGPPINAWPWVMIGTGAAIAAGGAVFTVSAISSRDEAEGLPPNAEQTDAISAYERDEVIAWVGYGVGGAAIIGGLVWLLTDDGDDAASAWRATPNGVQVQW